MPSLSQVPLPLSNEQRSALLNDFDTVEQYLLEPEKHTGSEAENILLRYIAQHVAPPVIPASSLFRALTTSTAIFQTGVAPVDALLDGGFRQGQLTELTGETAAGKTQICMAAAVRGAAAGSHVVYLDTSNAVTLRRLMQLHAALLQAPPLSDVLRRIELHRVYDVHEVSASLDALAARWASPETTATVAPVKQQGVPSAAAGGRLDSQLPGLVIVDSVSAAIAPVYGRPMQGSEVLAWQTLMHGVARLMKALATRCNVAVVCTNHIVGGSQDPRPALGEGWRGQPSVRLLLVHAGPAGERQAVLLASGRRPTPQSVYYCLSEGMDVLLPDPQDATAAS